MSSSSTVSPSVVITRDKTSRQDKMLAVNIYTCICFLIVSVREFWTVCPHSPRLVYGQSHLFCRRRARERERERERRSLYLRPSCKWSQKSRQARHHDQRLCVCQSTGRFRPNLGASIAIFVLMKTNILSGHVIFSEPHLTFFVPGS